MKLPRSLAGGAKLLVTLLLLYFVFQSVDLSKIARDLGSFSAASLLALLACCWAGQLLCSERWRIFAASLRMRGRYLSFVQMYFTGMFFNIGLPSLVGGDAVKAYIVSRRHGQPFQAGLASVLQDRGAGLLALLLFGSAAILISPASWRGIPLWIAYLLLWIAAALLLWLLFKGDRLYRRFLNPAGRAPWQKALRTAAGFHQALGVSSLPPGAALRVVFYSLIYSGLVLWVFQQVTAAAGHEVGIVPFSALFPLITIGTMLPVTLGGIGIREWLYVEALSLVGIPPAQALAISLATSALLLTCNLAGILFLPAIPKELRPQTLDFRDNPANTDAAEHRIPQRNDVI